MLLSSKYLQGTVITLGLAGALSAQITGTIPVTADISTPTIWGPAGTPGAVGGGGIYELDGEIHVLDGAILTIVPGTVIASDTTVTFPTPGSGPASLSVDRGGFIDARGLPTNPIVFTSKADGTTPALSTDPVSGTPSNSINLNGAHRPTATAEWGGISIHGEGYVSYCVSGTTNTAVPSSSNEAPMEGLLRAGLRNYGGGKLATLPGADGDGDNDNSGYFQYVSIRYNGFVAGLTVELNGLGLGGVGRQTDIHHVESINSLDDGIEIWGGAPRLHHIAVWACGDDSIDFDQGFRGAIQHGLIVQGFTTATAQGSGLSDNCLEMDGAEQCHWQPVSSVVIANVTVVGMPDTTGTGTASGLDGGDHAMAFRDNARVQLHRMMFVDVGDRLVSNDNTDGERCNNGAGNGGYGCFGTLAWASTWTTSSGTLSAVNPFPGGAEATPTEAYLTSSNMDFGANSRLNEVKDSLVCTLNGSPTLLTEATARGVFGWPADDGINNNNGANVTTGVLPIAALTRSASVNLTGLTGSPSSVDVANVAFLDPRPVSADARSFEWEAGNTFLDGSRFRGGFGFGRLWTSGWTGIAAYGLIASDAKNIDLGLCNNPGSKGCPELSIDATWVGGTSATWTVSNMGPVPSLGVPDGFCFLAMGFSPTLPSPIPAFGGLLFTGFPPAILESVLANFGSASGTVGGTGSLTITYPMGLPPATMFSQAMVLDETAFGPTLPLPAGASWTNVVMSVL